VAIADLYNSPTVRGLARLIEGRVQDSKPAVTVEAADRVPRRSIVAASATQFALLYLMFLALAAPLVPTLTGLQGSFTLAGAVAAAVAVPAALIAMAAILPVVGVRLAMHGVRPGRYRLWGVTYLRWWISRKLMALSPMTVLSGSPFAAPYLRALGATVGTGCHLGTSRFELPPLTHIGDGASIGYGATVQPYIVEAGWLVLGRVVVGPGAFVGANAVVLAGAQIGADAQLAEQSLLGADQSIPPGQRWSGSPAKPTAQSDEVLDAMESAELAARGWSGGLLALCAAATVALLALPFAAGLPSAAVLMYALRHHGLVGAVLGAVVAGPLYVLSTCGLIAGAHRLVVGGETAGIAPARSLLGLRKWIADKLMESSVALTNALFGTVFAAAWLRRLGATVGKRAEVSTVANIDPHMLTLGAETFVADLASVGGATFHRGLVSVGPTVLDQRCFVGNAAMVQAGSRLGEGSLVGVHTVAPRGDTAGGVILLGSPPLRLPRRQPSEQFADELTYRPSRWRILERGAIEFFRVTLPPTLVALAGVFVLLACAQVSARLGMLGLAAVLPAFVLAAGVGLTIAVVGAKWILVGRYRPRVAPLWSRFVRRSELVTGLYESVAVPSLLNWLAGSWFLVVFLRLFGADIGPRVWLDTTFLSEFDLVRVRHDACVAERTSLQTHLFEDRVMKLSQLDIGAGVTVGSRSVVLYDAEIGDGASLDALSLVMKAEHIPPGTQWRGIPAQRV
jgi:non-ribosomal peptide synthetase-like protein